MSWTTRWIIEATKRTYKEYDITTLEAWFKKKNRTLTARSSFLYPQSGTTVSLESHCTDFYHLTLSESKSGRIISCPHQRAPFWRVSFLIQNTLVRLSILFDATVLSSSSLHRIQSHQPITTHPFCWWELEQSLPLAVTTRGAGTFFNRDLGNFTCVCYALHHQGSHWLSSAVSLDSV